LSKAEGYLPGEEALDRCNAERKNNIQEWGCETGFCKIWDSYDV